MIDDLDRLKGAIRLPDGLKPVEEKPRPTPDRGIARPSFKKIMNDLVKDVDQLHKAAEKTTEKLVTGELEDVHQVVVAMEEAQTSFRLMMEIRNKMVEAYKEIMKMQV